MCLCGLVIKCYERFLKIRLLIVLLRCPTVEISGSSEDVATLSLRSVTHMHSSVCGLKRAQETSFLSPFSATRKCDCDTVVHTAPDETPHRLLCTSMRSVLCQVVHCWTSSLCVVAKPILGICESYEGEWSRFK